MLDQVILYGRKQGWKYIELRGRQHFLEGSALFLYLLRPHLELSQDPDHNFLSIPATVQKETSRRQEGNGGK